MTTKCVLVDFDGTITTIDTVRYLLVELLRLRPWRAYCLVGLLASKIAASAQQQVQIQKNRTIGSLIEGLGDADLVRAVARYHAKVQPKLRATMKTMIDEALSAGDLVLVVTASPQFAVEGIFEQAGILCIGTRYRKSGQKYDGTSDGDPCYGQAKVAAIHSALRDVSGGIDFTAAWSDALSDLPMMMLARKRFWIYRGSDYSALLLADPDATFVSGESLK